MKTVLRITLLGPIYFVGLAAFASVTPLVAGIDWLTDEDPRRSFVFLAEEYRAGWQIIRYGRTE